MPNKKDLESSSKSGQLPKRLLLILLFAGIGYVVFLGILMVSAFQLLLSVFSEQKNKSLHELCEGLSAYLLRVIAFISLSSEEVPWPK